MGILNCLNISLWKYPDLQYYTKHVLKQFFVLFAIVLGRYKNHLDLPLKGPSLFFKTEVTESPIPWRVCCRTLGGVNRFLLLIGEPGCLPENCRNFGWTSAFSVYKPPDFNKFTPTTSQGWGWSLRWITITLHMQLYVYWYGDGNNNYAGLIYIYIYIYCLYIDLVGEWQEDWWCIL